MRAVRTEIARAYALGDGICTDHISDRVMRATSALGDFAIKIFDDEDRPLAKREAALLRHLHTTTASLVPALVTTADAQDTFDLDDACVLVTRWLHGSKKDFLEISEGEWHVLGSHLAQLHTSLDDAPNIAIDRVSAYWNHLDLRAEREHLERDAGTLCTSQSHDANELNRYFDARRALLAAHGERARDGVPDDKERPIHNDYNVHNYLFRSDAPPIILDWEASVGAPREYEVVRCLNHLPLVRPNAARSFLSGYTSQRSLDRAKIRWAIDATLTMHALKHWPVRAWIDNQTKGSVLLHGSMSIVNALHAGKDDLVAFFEGSL